MMGLLNDKIEADKARETSEITALRSQLAESQAEVERLLSVIDDAFWKIGQGQQAEAERVLLNALPTAKDG